ncbi:MAG: ATP-dependent DNA helicase [Actinomycetaceae bacterium]|nr:ATP-dependent DNA helicase [Actinomycetaceae bacterium]
MSSEDLQLLTRVVSRFGGARREGQERMVDLVAHALDENEHVVVQAGTGTGKSLGYLVPAMRRAVEAGYRVVVSTASVALQRQIVTKDAPQVNGQLDTPARVALLKGWSNYLCLHKVHGGYPDQEALFDDAPTEVGREIIRLRTWAEETDTGDRDDLVPGVSDRAWQQVSVNTLECIGPSCPMRDECFPNLAREDAKEAHVVVTNHAMLGIHAATDNAILGDFDALIVDEAHDLTRIIRSQATRRISAPTITYRARKIRRITGVNTQTLEQCAQTVEDILDGLDEGLMAVRPQELVEGLDLLGTQVRNIDREIRHSSTAEAAEKKLAGATLADITDFLEMWNRKPDDTITWISRSEDSPTYVNCAPLDVSRPIADRLLSDVPAVLTSATLQVGGRFDAIVIDTGMNLSDHTTVTADVGTPFDLERQGIVYVAGQLPAPQRSGVSDAQLDELVALAEASGGGVLALFSSRKGAEQGAEALREALDLPVLVQGEDQLSTLVAQFAADEDACLVGTMSLWQGIDVAGRACRLVTIDRIPFPVPSDPIIAARTRHVAKQGRNAFVEISLNSAALLMSQAAGRLLRSSSDRGMIAILDSRVASKSYGSFIMRTLPKLWPTQNRDVALASLRRLRSCHNSAELGSNPDTSARSSAAET